MLSASVNTLLPPWGFGKADTLWGTLGDLGQVLLTRRYDAALRGHRTLDDEGDGGGLTAPKPHSPRKAQKLQDGGSSDTPPQRKL